MSKLQEALDELEGLREDTAAEKEQVTTALTELHTQVRALEEQVADLNANTVTDDKLQQIVDKAKELRAGVQNILEVVQPNPDSPPDVPPIEPV